MKKNQKEAEDLTNNEADKKIALWQSEKLIVKLLIQCIVDNYRICIDSSDGIKVWIENETEDTRLSKEQKEELIKELQRHIK